MFKCAVSILALATAACAATAPPAPPVAVVEPAPPPKVVIVDRPVVVEKPVIVERRVIVEKTSPPARPHPTAGRLKPRPPPQAAPCPTIIDLNRASSRELECLPGIGKKRAALIIAARPYRTADDLVARRVLTAGIVRGLAGRLSVR